MAQIGLKLPNCTKTGFLWKYYCLSIASHPAKMFQKKISMTDHEI